MTATSGSSNIYMEGFRLMACLLSSHKTIKTGESPSPLMASLSEARWRKFDAAFSWDTTFEEEMVSIRSNSSMQSTSVNKNTEQASVKENTEQVASRCSIFPAIVLALVSLIFSNVSQINAQMQEDEAAIRQAVGTMTTA